MEDMFSNVWNALVLFLLCVVCLFVSIMPLTCYILPLTFVMEVCHTSGFSQGLRDSLVSFMNEDFPKQPPPIYRPLYNTQERDTHLLINTRHALAHLKLFSHEHWYTYCMSLQLGVVKQKYNKH